MKEVLSKLKDNVPIISAGFIFLGYWNLDSYYKGFGIDIYNYISASEILLSFLPILKTISILLLSLIVSLLFISTSSLLDKEGFNSEERENELDPRTFNLVKLLGKIKLLFSVDHFFLYTQYYVNLILLISRMIGIAFMIGLFIFTCNLGAELYYAIHTPIYLVSNLNTILFETFLFIILSYAFLYNTVIKHFIEPVMKFFETYDLIILSLLIYFTINYEYNLARVTKILHRINTPKVSFSLNDVEITTDSTLQYIGHTQSYIFFRNYTDSSNVIYKLSDVQKLVIDKNIGN